MNGPILPVAAQAWRTLVMSTPSLSTKMRRLCPLLPIILVSGYVGDIAVSDPDNGSADEVLIKPLRENALETSLARLLGTA
jgi:hypothetical protein